MTQPIVNVTLVGAGGNLGPSILDGLLAEGFKVTILARKGSSSKFPAGVKVVHVDEAYDVEEVATALQGQEAVISTISDKPGNPQKRLIDAAVKAGVRRFIPSEFGSNTQNHKALSLAPPVFSSKAATNEYLASLETSGMSWTALATGPFFDWGLDVGFLDFDLKKQTAHIVDGGDIKFSSSSLPAIGLATARILKHPEQTKNKYLYISTTNATQNEILASLEKQTGKKWAVTHARSEDDLAAAKKNLAGEDFMAGFLGAIKVNLYLADTGNNFERDTILSNDLLGVETEDLDEQIAKALKRATH